MKGLFQLVFRTNYDGMDLFLTPEVFHNLFQCSDEDPYLSKIIWGKSHELIVV